MKSNFQFLKRKVSMVLIAFMLGVSNVILEEDRTIYDTRVKVEQQEVQPDDDPLSAKLP